jgi:folate-binding protein YgfZ
MPDNPTLPAGPFALPDHRVLELSGRDAGAFAHAQFMNDVATLAAGRWQWNGWLTPKGRVVALFALLKLDAERLWLLLPDVDPEELSTKLQRFVFRSKVAIRARPDCRVTGGFVVPTQARDADIHAFGEHRVELDFGAEGGPRTLWIDAAKDGAPPDDGQAMDEPAAMRHWKAFDTRHGLPRLPPSQAEQWTPQMLSLDRLRAFSVRKGCYPGQEIVARTHFLGQAKRGLVLLEATAPVEAGSEIRLDDQAIGTTCSAAGHLALAVLPQARESGALAADGIALRERPLVEGLAR